MANINNFSIESLEQLKLHFSNKNWSLDTPHTVECFNRFCNMLSHYSDSEQKCILELLNNFLKIDLRQYYDHTVKSLLSIDQDSLNGITKIYVMPILKDGIQSKGLKSSVSIAYSFKGKDMLIDANMANFNFKVIDNISSLPSNFNAKPCKLLLVDDFIGSGDTVISCLKVVRTKVDVQNIIILSLVIQNLGYELLKSENYQVVFSELRKRGINDTYGSPIKERLASTMEKIENRLGVEPEHKFGYKQTEALVKMVRTPNNTFPIFWKTPTSKDLNYLPPFER
jgi:hypothetical protein